MYVQAGFYRHGNTLCVFVLVCRGGPLGDKHSITADTELPSALTHTKNYDYITVWLPVPFPSIPLTTLPTVSPYSAKPCVLSTAKIITTIVCCTHTHTHTHAKCATCLPATPSVSGSHYHFFSPPCSSDQFCYCFCGNIHSLVWEKSFLQMEEIGVTFKFFHRLVLLSQQLSPFETKHTNIIHGCSVYWIEWHKQ